MALLDRVKERVEQDLSDGELEALIGEAQAAIEARYGLPAGAPITVTLEGHRKRLDLARPAEQAEAIAVTEYLSDNTPTVLASNDFRVWNGGRTLQRLRTGTHPRFRWPSRVDVEYVPVDDTAQRDEVTIKLVQLAVEYEGVAERTVGDVRTVHHRSTAGAGTATGYTEERDRLLASLEPRPGIFLR
jgi:hypothetical protein